MWCYFVSSSSINLLQRKSKRAANPQQRRLWYRLLPLCLWNNNLKIHVSHHLAAEEYEDLGAGKTEGSWVLVVYAVNVIVIQNRLKNHKISCFCSSDGVNVFLFVPSRHKSAARACWCIKKQKPHRLKPRRSCREQRLWAGGGVALCNPQCGIPEPAWQLQNWMGVCWGHASARHLKRNTHPESLATRGLFFHVFISLKVGKVNHISQPQPNPTHPTPSPLPLCSLWRLAGKRRDRIHKYVCVLKWERWLLWWASLGTLFANCALELMKRDEQKSASSTSNPHTHTHTAAVL